MLLQFANWDGLPTRKTRAKRITESIDRRWQCETRCHHNQSLHLPSIEQSMPSNFSFDEGKFAGELGIRDRDMTPGRRRRSRKTSTPKSRGRDEIFGQDRNFSSLGFQHPSPISSAPRSTSCWPFWPNILPRRLFRHHRPNDTRLRRYRNQCFVVITPCKTRENAFDTSRRWNSETSSLKYDSSVNILFRRRICFLQASLLQLLRWVGSKTQKSKRDSVNHLNRILVSLCLRLTCG
jgi:hypothetical protein